MRDITHLRGRLLVVLFALAVSAGFLLSGCDLLQPTPEVNSSLPPAITLLPTITMLPTATPFVLPMTGSQVQPVNPGLADLATILPGRSTPANGTPQPETGKVNPIGATLTAMAGQIGPTRTPAPPPTLGPTATRLPTAHLTGGQLGLLPSNQGLWAIRPDGTQATLLTNDPIYHMAVSPGGTMVAYITNPDPNVQIYDQPYAFTLKIITLYDDKVYLITPLTRPGLGPKSPQPDLDSAFMTLRAYDSGGMTWSPDGRILAFVAAREGISADIYLYTPAAGDLRRLTTFQTPKGPVYASALNYSPDGLRIYYNTVYSFGSGAGDWIAGAWVDGVNGGHIQVGPSEQTAGESLIAWLPGPAALLSSWNPDCGDQNLRVVNLQNGAARVLWPGCYASLRYDRVLGEVALSVTQAIADPQKNAEGVYAININSGKPQQISQKGYEKIYNGNYLAAWYAYNQGEGMVAIQRSGKITPVYSGAAYNGADGPPPKPLVPFSSGQGWLFTGSQGELMLAQPGQDPQTLIQMRVQKLTQSAGYPGIYFFFAQDQTGTFQLYAVRTRDWKPYLVDPRIQNPQDLVWAP